MRWKEMWRLGKEAGDADRVLNLSAQHIEQRRANDGNVMWNWKTLLLMQRAGMIRLIMDEPRPPDWNPAITEVDNIKLRDKYFDVTDSDKPEYYTRKAYVADLIIKK